MIVRRDDKWFVYDNDRHCLGVFETFEEAQRCNYGLIQSAIDQIGEAMRNGCKNFVERFANEIERQAECAALQKRDLCCIGFYDEFEC